MDRRTLAFSAALALSITLRAIPITARQSAAPPSASSQGRNSSSQPPTPTDVPRRQEQQNVARGQSNAGSNTHLSSTPPVTPVVGSGSDGEDNPSDGKSKNTSPHDWWTNGPSLIQALAALASTLITIAIYFIYTGQLRVMKHQAVVMRLALKANRRTIDKMDEIAKSQSADLEKSIKEAARAATAMEVNTGIAATAVQQADRPWLSVKAHVLTQIRIKKTDPLALRVLITVTNVGRSAAQHVQLVVDMLADEDSVDPMSEITRVLNAAPKPSLGGVVLPTDQLVREFTLTVGPVEDHYGLRPTIFGGVRYTHGRATSGLAIPPQSHSTTFGFRVVPKNNLASRLIDEQDGAELWIWDPEVVTSSRDFNYAE